MMPASPPQVNWAGVSRIILGSKSWSRKTLLRELKPPEFVISVPAIDERAVKADTARDLVIDIACAKARALLARHDFATLSSDVPSDGKTLLICGDAVVTHKGTILGKPRDVADAKQILNSYADAPVTTVSSIVVVDVGKRVFWADVDEAEVYFRPLSPEVIDQVIDDGALESAGALRIEHPHIQPFVECIVGHISAVMGFSQPVLAALVHNAVSENAPAMRIVSVEDLGTLPLIKAERT